MLKGFRDFVFRGNVIDLAVGIIIGAAFSALVASLVADIFTPLISAIFKTPDFANLAITINDSKIMYGNFLNAIIAFLLSAIAIYFGIVLPMNKMTERFMKKPETTKTCSECAASIPVAAKRCMYCTQMQIDSTF